MQPDDLRAELAERGAETQIAAAALLGVSQMTISRWLRGESRIPKMTAAALKAIPRKRTAQVERQTLRSRNGKSNTRNK